MVRAIIGGLLGGLALYVIGFLFWGTPLSALVVRGAEPQASANLQAALAQALGTAGTGFYIIPDSSTAEGTVLYGRGPVAQIFYNSGGFPVMDSSALIGGLILALVVGVVIALALRAIASDFAGRVRLTLLLTLAAALWMHVGQAVFNHAPWDYILYFAFSDFVGLATAGLIAAKLLPDDRAAAPPVAPSANTFH